jgi:hypothetical protein
VTDDRGFGKWLVERGLLSEGDLRRARDAQRGQMGRLDTELIELQLLSESETLEALGKYHKTRTVSGAELQYASSAAVRMLTPRIASRLGVVPFKIEGKTLSVATLNPGDLLAEDEIAQQTGCLIASFVTLEIRFMQALKQHYHAPVTARYVGLIRRLSGLCETPTSDVAQRQLHEDEPTPVISAPVESARRAVARRRESVDRPSLEPLEISADELDLFPSLREEGPADEASPGGDSSGAVDGSTGSRAVRPASRGLRSTELGPEVLLEAASHAMQNVEMRDDIADAMLGFCAPLFCRRMMLVLRRETVMGWRGEGEGIDEREVRSISIPAEEPSVFSGLLQGIEFWLGSLPSMPNNEILVQALGGSPPNECYILPVRVRDRTVCFFYGDNRDEGVGGLPIGELKRLASKASLGFQIYLMKGKIRTL